MELPGNIVVTGNVHAQLTKVAQAQIPKSTVERIGDAAGHLAFLAFWASSPFVALVFFDGWTAGLWLFLFGWLLLVPLALSEAIDKMLAKPRLLRREQIVDRVHALAQERQRGIEERQAFYSSAEWKVIRSQVIREEGRTCGECEKRIARDSDVSVDHKYPRSKYPELALRRDNLRVVCRECNSRKGDSEWSD